MGICRGSGGFLTVCLCQYRYAEGGPSSALLWEIRKRYYQCGGEVRDISIEDCERCQYGGEVRRKVSSYICADGGVAMSVSDGGVAMSARTGEWLCLRGRGSGCLRGRGKHLRADGEVVALGRGNCLGMGTGK